MASLTERNKNFGQEQQAARALTAAAEAEMQRAVAEVQGAIILAKKFPRDVDQAIHEIVRECGRLQLAEVATYEYSRGGTKIEGPSIRLAEVMAIAWKNIHSGWREMGRIMVDGKEFAEVEAWAWDLESNMRRPIQFKVRLWRSTKSGGYALTDDRDIYEHCANQAARRERACILKCIPTYIQDMAVDAVKETLKNSITPETTGKIIKAFQDKFGVTQAQIEAFIQKKIEAIEPGQVVRLRNIYNSLRDGMSKKEDWFEAVDMKQPDAEKTNGKKAAAKKDPEKKADDKKPEPAHDPETGEVTGNGGKAEDPSKPDQGQSGLDFKE